jgi:uncharacterized protein YjbI with pentapeptide repeats
MGQHQPPRRCWKDNRLTWALAALALTGLVITTSLGYWQRWAWTEFLWRWLELLIIPLVLALGALWFNNQTRKSEQAIAQDRAREDALQRYLDRISELVLDKNLLGSKRDDAVQATARARTLTVLRSLDGNRKGDVVRFLYEAELIGKSVGESDEISLIETIVDLRTADLSSANLFAARLGGVDLLLTNLSNANLSGTELRDANLGDTDLGGANLSGANLSNATLGGANLSAANLRYANLSDANLSGANLSGADLRDTNLAETRNWINQQLARAFSLVGATMPDRTVMTEEAWEEFKKRYRQ